jgi:hypothetical protein
LPKKEHLYTWKISSLTPGNQWIMEHHETKDGSRLSTERIAPFPVVKMPDTTFIS